MDEIFELLRQSRKANQQAMDLEGRSPFVTKGIVANNQDPTGDRRIKVTTQDKGGLTESGWLWRVVDSPYDDPPLPRLGQTVVVAFFDGDAHEGCYWGTLTNAPNPARAKAEPEKDDWERVEGIQTIEVENDRILTVGGQWDITTEFGTHHQTELLMYQLFRLWLSSALPAASEQNRGKMLVVTGAPTLPDKAFICLKNGNGTYTWREFASGLS